MMLENPQEYAQTLILERLPVPRFVSCDYGSGQERLIKCVVSPIEKSNKKNANSKEMNSKIIEDGSYVSDDVSWNIFYEHLKKKSVQS